MRKAQVFINNILAGELTELDTGEFQFTYQSDYYDRTKFFITHL